MVEAICRVLSRFPVLGKVAGRHRFSIEYLIVHCNRIAACELTSQLATAKNWQLIAIQFLQECSNRKLTL